MSAIVAGDLVQVTRKCCALNPGERLGYPFTVDRISYGLHGCSICGRVLDDPGGVAVARGSDGSGYLVRTLTKIDPPALEMTEPAATPEPVPA